MGENSAIQWTDHTFNPWWGCTKVSPGCEHCYAETLAVTRRQLPVWGPAPRFGRKMMSDQHWHLPERWNRQAERDGVRGRVFCASMADVFDEHPDVVESRERLWRLIEETPFLDWQILTKRPQNVARMVPQRWMDDGFPRNVWVGTSVEDQAAVEERIPHLLQIPAVIRFLSCEPLLGPVDLKPWATLCRAGLVTDETGQYSDALHGMALDTRVFSRPDAWALHWVIVGGESGRGARPNDLKWVLDLIWQCYDAGLACFVKQLGARFRIVSDPNRLPHAEDWAGITCDLDPASGIYARFCDRKGGDPAEWPPHLRIRQFPRSAVEVG